MAQAEIKSPDSLQLSVAPKLGVRLGRKAGFAVGTVIFIALALIIYGIASREPAGTRPKEAPTSKNVRPATAAGKKLYEGVGDGSVALPPVLAEAKPVEATPPPLAGAPGTSSTVPDLKDASGKSPGQLQTAQQQSEQATANKLKEMYELDRQKAMASDTTAKEFMPGSSAMSGGSAGAGANAATSINDQRAALANLLLPKANAASNDALNALAARAGLGKVGGDDDPNLQGRKESFLDKANALPETNSLRGTRRMPISKFELKATAVIPAVLITGLNSDLPGEVIAQVSENVCDTATGQHLLIPQGTRVSALYDNRIAFGQSRALVPSNRLIFPDGSSIDLEGMSAADTSGYTGMEDQVNNHYGRLLSFAALTSLFSSAFTLTQPQQSTLQQSQTPAQVASGEIARQFSQLGIQVTQRNLAVQPTIEIRPGYKFLIRVNKDMVFSRAYNNLAGNGCK